MEKEQEILEETSTKTEIKEEEIEESDEDLSSGSDEEQEIIIKNLNVIVNINFVLILIEHYLRLYKIIYGLLINVERCIRNAGKNGMEIFNI